MQAAFVEVSIFNSFFSTTPNTVSQKVVSLTGPDFTTLEGVLISLTDMKTIPELRRLPPHFAAVFYETDRALQEVLLSPDQIRRVGQADERFQY